MFTRIIVLAFLLSPLSALGAEQVTLKNGDRLSGTIVGMDGKKLTLKTDYAGEVALDWSAVAQLSSEQPLVVIRSDKTSLSGTVVTEAPDLLVSTAQGARRVPLSDVAAVRSPAAQTAYERSLHPGMLEGWSGGGNFALALARGNSETTNLALGFNALRKTANDALTLDAASIYSTDQRLNATTANAFHGSLRYDRNLTHRLFAYGVFAGEFDRLQNLDSRFMPGVGVGLHFLNTAQTTLDLLGGLGYTRENYSTGLTRNFATATVGDEFTHKLTSVVALTQNFYFLPSLNDTSNYRANFNVGIATKLSALFTANLNFSDRYNSQPILGDKQNDVLFTTGLGVTFGAKTAAK